jgi:hypothetical protein
MRVVGDAGYLRRTPVLIGPQSGDNIGISLTVSRVVEAAVEAVVYAGANRILERNRRRIAAAESGGIGEHVGLVAADPIGGIEIVPARSAAKIGKEGADAPGCEASPLNVGDIQEHRRRNRLEAVALIGLNFCVATQQAERRHLARIEIDLASRGEAEPVASRRRGAVTTTVTQAITSATNTLATALNAPPAPGTTTVNVGPNAYFQTVVANAPAVAGGVTTRTVTVSYAPTTAEPPAPPTRVEIVSTTAVTSTTPTTTTDTTSTPAPPSPPSLSVSEPSSAPRMNSPGWTPFGAASVADNEVPSDVESAVKAASDEAQQAMQQCQVDAPPCIADALDAYAAALQKLAPELPPRLRVLPSIIAKAARQVRVAKSKAEAVRAIKTAIAAVHKTISLLKADDPLTRQAGTRDGALVAQTLQVASDKLEKAVGL